jgi:hypothetical protein
LRLLALAAIGSLAMAAEAPAQPGAAGQELIAKHRPILRYDSRERFFARPVDGGRADLVYAHAAAEDGQEWIQYWMYFSYNPQDRGIFRTGRHEGDWEFVQVRIGSDGRPDRVTLSQHNWAEGCEWEDIRRRGPAPVVHVANGSHALYSEPGTADRPFPDPNDEADGDGRQVRPRVQTITDGDPAWVEHREPWGDSREGWVPGEQSSPNGPKFQEHDAWARPAGYHAEARECGSGPPGRLWQTAATLALALLVALVLAVALRRRYLQSPR